MYIDYSSIFHRSSKDLSDKGAVRIAPNTDDWPDEWKTVYYKTYPRMPRIKLAVGKPRADFFSVIKKRHSTRSFAAKPVDFKQLSLLLLWACGITHVLEDGTSARAHASGGARFPIEIYPLVFKGSKDVPAGLYHYNVKEHALECLWEKELGKKEISNFFVYDFVQNASFALILTGMFPRTQNKYGERGYRYVLLEAGHVSENVYLCAEALGIGCCAMTGIRDINMEQFLDIDGVTESVLHSLILG